MTNRSGSNKNGQAVKVEMMNESIKEMKNDIRRNAEASKSEHDIMASRIGKVEENIIAVVVKLNGLLWLAGVGIASIIASIHWERIFGG